MAQNASQTLTMVKHRSANQPRENDGKWRKHRPPRQTTVWPFIHAISTMNNTHETRVGSDARRVPQSARNRQRFLRTVLRPGGVDQRSPGRTTDQ